jgi:hypothetical protein
MEPERHDEVTFMPDRVPRALVLRLLLATVLISIALCVVAYLLLGLRESQLRAGRNFPEQHLGAPHPVAHVRQAPFAAAPSPTPLRQRQRLAVDGYSWVDRPRRIVRIPVKRAVELLLARGAPP